jgi:redox-sensitive bicupin YhaK (pirin superfamily)
MLSIKRSEERGFVDHGWLKSQHSFSFGGYYDARYMGVSALRVFNDDRVEAGTGFPSHPHQDMEILSYVLEGSLEHKDSMGNIQTMIAGEFQLMSAGTGVTHSEYNPLPDSNLRFLQIWIQPDELGIAPVYQQKLFAPQEGLKLIAAPAGNDTDAFTIHQDARVYRVQLAAGCSVEISAQDKRPQYLHLISGQLDVKSLPLNGGDALTVREEELEIKATEAAEALLFDLPSPSDQV